MGNVYFMSCGEWVKIGYAEDVAARLAQLQTGNPRGLSILAVIPNAPPSLERLYHGALRSHRERGEWFKLAKLRPLIRQIREGEAPRTVAAITYYLEILPKRPVEYTDPELQAACREVRFAMKHRGFDRDEWIARGGQFVTAVKICEARASRSVKPS